MQEMPVGKVSCDLGVLHKASGLRCYTRSEGQHELPLVWG